MDSLPGLDSCGPELSVIRLFSVGGAAAWDQVGDEEQSKIAIGFEIAPVPLNLEGKNHDLVGLGSFTVNAQAGCNGCHSAVTDTGPTEYAFGGNPYFGQSRKKVNPATYMGGGDDFGPLVPGTLHIISRNLPPRQNWAAGSWTHIFRFSSDHTDR